MTSTNALNKMITYILTRDMITLNQEDVAQALYETVTFKPSAQFFTISVDSTLIRGTMKISAGSSILANQFKSSINSKTDEWNVKAFISMIAEQEQYNVELYDCIEYIIDRLATDAEPQQYCLGKLPVLRNLMTTEMERIIPDKDTCGSIFITNTVLNILHSINYMVIAAPNEMTFTARYKEHLLKFVIPNSVFIKHDLNTSDSPTNVAKFLHLMASVSDLEVTDLPMFVTDVVKEVMDDVTGVSTTEEEEELVPDINIDTYELSDELKSYFPEGWLLEPKNTIMVNHNRVDGVVAHTLDVGPILIKVDSSFENITELVVTDKLEVRTVVVDAHLVNRVAAGGRERLVVTMDQMAQRRRPRPRLQKS